MLDRTQTVADLVLDHSECAAVFRRHRINFCCAGDRSVEQAAEAKGLDLDALLEDLSQAIAGRRGEQGENPRELSTAQLITHILSSHHKYLREALPLVDALAAKVSRVHGEYNPKLRSLASAVEELAATLVPHLDEEEQLLFPALTTEQIERALVADRLRIMEQEHRALADLLERVRAASDDFTMPDWACTSYRTLFSELAQLEADVHTLVHIESHVLKPRFAA